MISGAAKQTSQSAVLAKRAESVKGLEERLAKSAYNDATRQSQHVTKFINAIFKEYGILDCVVDSYDQFLDEIQNIIHKFNLSHKYQNDSKQTIIITMETGTFEFKLNGLKNGTEATCQRKDDYDARCSTDVTLTISCPTMEDAQDRQVFTYNTKNFYIDIPVMSGCKYDPVTRMTPRQRWDLGVDVNQIVGDLYFKGTPYIVQNTFSNPYNSPLVVETDLDGQVVTAQYLKQEDPMNGNVFYTTYVFLKYKQKNVELYDIALKFKQAHDPRFKQNLISISLLFKLFGLENDTEIIDMCNPDKDEAFTLFLINTFRNGPITTEQLKTKRKYDVNECVKLMSELILKSNVFTEEDTLNGIDQYIFNRKKPFQYCQTLAEMVRKLYYAFTTQTFSDRDSMQNHRILTVGPQIIAELRTCLQDAFHQSIKQAIQQITQMDFMELKDNQVVEKQFQQQTDQMSELLTQLLKKSFSSSAQTDQETSLHKNMNEQKTHILDVFQKKEIVIRQESMGGKITWEQRRIQYSFYGFVCGITSPESGAAVGRYISPTVYAYFTVAKETSAIVEYLASNKLVSDSYSENTMPVKINYIVHGFVKNSKFKQLYKELMEWRLKHAFASEADTSSAVAKQDDKRGGAKKNSAKEVSEESSEHAGTDDKVSAAKPSSAPTSFTKSVDQMFTSVYYDVENPEINIMTDQGREMIPIISRKWDEKMTFREMCENGTVIWICQKMIDNFCVGEYGQIDLPQADASDLLGEIYSWWFLPYGLVGLHPASSPFINNLKAIRAAYSGPQSKQNMSQPYTNSHVQSTGQQLIINQTQHCPIDTSMCRSQFKKWPIAQLVYLSFLPATDNQEDALVGNRGYFARGGGASSMYKTYFSQCEDSEQFTKIARNISKGYNYGLVDPEAHIPREIGLAVKFGDVIISKVQNIGNELINRSTTYDQNYETVYTQNAKVLTRSVNDDYEKVVTIQMTRLPIEGDKVVSRNAQKSIIGKSVKEYLANILANGIIPTFLMSCFPVLKRETYGQLQEAVMGTWLCTEHHYTMNKGIDEHVYQKQLRSVEQLVMFNGQFGKQLSCSKVMGGPMCYAFQKHLVAAKLYARDIGPVDKITRQPTQGRQKMGGMRVGNLDMSALFGHASTNVLRDQAGVQSSMTKWFICRQCRQAVCYRHRTPQVDDLGQSFQYYCPCCGILDEPIIMGNSFQQGILQWVLQSLAIGVLYLDDASV